MTRMELQWSWNEKVGEATFNSYTGDEYTCNLYQGNAFLIVINEYTEKGEEKYNLISFFADKQHAKNCLGLNKKYSPDNIWGNAVFYLDRITIYKDKYSYTKDLISLLIQTFDAINIQIELSKLHN